LRRLRPEKKESIPPKGESGCPLGDQELRCGWLKIIATVLRGESVEAWFERTVPVGVVLIGEREKRVLTEWSPRRVVVPGKVIHEMIALHEMKGAEGCPSEERSLGIGNDSPPNALRVATGHNVTSTRAVAVFRWSAGPDKVVGASARITMPRGDDGQGRGMVVRRREVVEKRRNQGDRGDASL
jgi:hypothetical protein